MEDATPIYQLQQQQQGPEQMSSSRKEPLEMMSYNDILKNMSDTQPQPVAEPKPIQPVMQQQHQQQQHQQPPPPQIIQQVAPGGAFPGLAYHVQAATPAPNNKPKATAADDVTFQNEMIALLGVYILVHTQQFQTTMQSKVPGIFQEDGSPSVVGTLVNGVLLIVLWNLCKKFLLKYMKDM